MDLNELRYRAQHCRNHHHACDCREYQHLEQVKQLEAQIAALKNEIEFFREWKKDIEIKDRGKTNEINILVQENNAQRKCLEAIREWHKRLGITSCLQDDGGGDAK